MKGIEILSGGRLISWLSGGTKAEIRTATARLAPQPITIRKNGKVIYIGRSDKF